MKKIFIHDYAGHPFQIDLSRELSKKYEVEIHHIINLFFSLSAIIGLAQITKILFNKKIKDNDKTYNMLNIIGSVLAIINVYHLLLYHFIILNLMWLFMSLYSLYINFNVVVQHDENDSIDYKV